MTDHKVNFTPYVAANLQLNGRWLGWNTEQWESAETWSKNTFGGWVSPDPVELRKLYRHAHAGADPVLGPLYDIELWNKNGTVDRVQVREYTLSTTGIKYRDMVMGHEVAYPLDTFREVRVRDMKEKRA